MNMIPPMVGVPSLLLCQLGPISLMDWPAWSARRAGMSTHPTAAEMPNAANAANSIRMVFPPTLFSLVILF